mgnify:CR=1 FL=1
MDPVVESDALRLVECTYGLDDVEQIMVTGASGMLGSYAIEILAQIGRIAGLSYPIYALSRNPSNYLLGLEREYPESVSIRRNTDIGNILRGGSNWLVIHSASPASPDEYVGQERGLLDTNLAMTTTIGESIRDQQSHVVYMSSGEVYGPSPELPTTETSFSAYDHLSDRGVYPEVKRAGEVILKVLSNEIGFSSTCLRVYHTFGPGVSLNQSRIFSTVLKAMLLDRPIELRTSGSARRSFLYSSDLMSAILLCRSQSGFRALNVSGAHEISIRDFAQLGSAIAGGNCRVEFAVSEVLPNATDASLPESPIMRGDADTGSLRSLGWKPEVSVSEALQRTLTSCIWRSSAGTL